MSKTLRIEKSLYEMVRTYIEKHNEIFGIELSERQVIESCIKKAMVEKVETLEGIILQKKLDKINNEM